MNEELQIELQKITQKQVDDHEGRIRSLEDSNTRMSVKLEEINTGQMKLQNMLLEFEKERNRKIEESYNVLQENINKQQNDVMTSFSKEITEIIKSSVSTSNKVKLINSNKFWVTITTLTGVLMIIVKYFFSK